MRIRRRDFTKLSGAALVATLAPGCSSAPEQPKEIGNMYGLIGRMTCVSGQRDAFIGILLESTAAMPGCLSYVVARDPQDGDALWITTGGEPYNAIQVELRRRFPTFTLLFSPLASELQVAYLLPADRYGQGLYQEEPSILAPGCLKMLTEAIAVRIDDLIS